MPIRVPSYVNPCFERKLHMSIRAIVHKDQYRRKPLMPIRVRTRCVTLSYIQLMTIRSYVDPCFRTHKALYRRQPQFRSRNTLLRKAQLSLLIRQRYRLVVLGIDLSIDNYWMRNVKVESHIHARRSDVWVRFRAVLCPALPPPSSKKKKRLQRSKPVSILAIVTSFMTKLIERTTARQLPRNMGPKGSSHLPGIRVLIRSALHRKTWRA